MDNTPQQDKPDSIKTNRLSGEKSPYLLQHKSNPVDWYPWGQEAFDKANKEDKPIFLSVGYSTCHWCHVMAHESFENQDTADIMNQYFVNIKVDREERPDIDKIYMTYVQALSGGGGWPMSVWLTPKLTPIIGGTYFPPADRYGLKGFPSILQHIAKMWKSNRDNLIAQGDKMMKILNESISESRGGQALSAKCIDTCFKQIERGYDETLGGFSSAPKFPRPVTFQLLYRVYNNDPKSQRSKRALEMALFTLTKMGHGGMYDQLGGGFHRYSVTSDWHVPHFEKMLYDQAQLAEANLVAFQITKDPFFEKIARGILDYVIRDMTSTTGGFYSAEDADSIIEHGKPEHAEGAFYVWKQSEIEALLGDHAKIFNYHYGVLPDGNAPVGGDPHGEFTGKNILIQRHSVSETAQKMGLSDQECDTILKECSRKLFEVRNKRPRPHLDDKIITAWNALMVSAFAHGYCILGEQKYLEAAKKSCEFIKKNLYKPETHTLIRNYREGPSTIEGFADDYAFLIQGLLDLYEASFEEKWLKWALDLQERQNELFWDSAEGSYFASQQGQADLLLRMKDDSDNAEPSNNSVSTLNLLRLAQISGQQKYRNLAEKTLAAFSNALDSTPVLLPYMCVAVDFYFSTPKQIIIVGKRDSSDVRALTNTVNSHFMPNKIILFGDQGEGQQYLATMLPIMKELGEKDGKATAYVCENFTCKLPVSTAEQLESLLA